MRIYKKVLYCVGGILLVLLLWFFFGGTETIDRPRTNAGENIIAFGDSLVYGTGTTAGNDFVSLLSRSLGVPIINAGVPGDTTQSAIIRLEEDVLSQSPKVVIILLGGNDTLRRFRPETTFSNLSTMIDRIHQTGAAVLLLGVRGSIINDRYEEKFEELEKTKGVSLVPDVLNGLLGRSKYMADGIHPNDLGHEKIAERIAPILKKMLK